MARIYLALEVDFDDDEKVARLARFTRPGEARAVRDLLVAMWRYCKRERSDGHVPSEMIGKLVYPDSPRIGKRDADRLVEVGIAERTDEGYYLPKYLKRNKSRAQLEAEATIKAEAGRKGGQRSGEVRKIEAPSQAGDEAERSSLLQPSEAIDIDTHIDNDKKLSTPGGLRTETLRPVDATKHPPEPPPGTRPAPRVVDESRCSKHPDGNANEACAGCARVREYRDKAADRDAEKRRRELEDARNHCDRCDGTWLIDEEGRPTRRKCDHQRRTA